MRGKVRTTVLLREVSIMVARELGRESPSTPPTSQLQAAALRELFLVLREPRSVVGVVCVSSGARRGGGPSKPASGPSTGATLSVARALGRRKHVCFTDVLAQSMMRDAVNF